MTNASFIVRGGEARTAPFRLIGDARATAVGAWNVVTGAAWTIAASRLIGRIANRWAIVAFVIDGEAAKVAAPHIVRIVVR